MALVKNNSRGYGYNFAGLSDVDIQGFKIPKMKTGTDAASGKDYVYYYDEVLNDWCRGAEIIIPEMKGSNNAQRYGAALSYARRYTTFMALSLATTDDDIIEKVDSEGNVKTVKLSVFDEEPKNAEKEKLVEDFYRRLSSNQIDFIYKKHGVQDAAELTVQQLKGYIDLQKSRENEKR